jgi:hypothetical protein
MSLAPESDVAFRFQISFNMHGGFGLNACVRCLMANRFMSARHDVVVRLAEVANGNTIVRFWLILPRDCYAGMAGWQQTSNIRS